ncbi:hypothetical protein Tco_1164297 [Tanacetum coccineum]
MRIISTKTQKKATYQVVLDTLTLSPCYNAFLITSNVPEIYMHQFWFTISKIKDSSTYKFKLDNKTFKIGVEVFREVLQICPRLPNQKFVEPPSHEETVSFIKEIGYKGDLESITELFTDHMYQPWRTCAAIINKCLSRNTLGLDQLRLSRAQILWGIYYKKNVDFVKLIWEDFMYQINNRQKIPKDVQTCPILEIMKTTTYKTYLAFSTGKSIPKKARKRTKMATTPKKKSSLSVDDNIILKDPDAALELAKSISRTEAEEQEATRLVHETHERLVIKQSTGTRKQTSVVFKDTPTVSKKKPLDQS